MLKQVSLAKVDFLQNFALYYNTYIMGKFSLNNITVNNSSELRKRGATFDIKWFNSVKAKKKGQGVK